MESQKPAATTSSTAPRLRPMDLGDILDGVFSLYRSNFLTFVGIIALLQVPVILLQLTMVVVFNQGVTADLQGLIRLLPEFNPQQDTLSDLPIDNLLSFMVSLVLFGLLQGVIVQQLINGALAHAIAQRYHHRPISILGAYGFGGQRMVSLIVAGLLISLLIGAILFLLVIALSVISGVMVGVGSSLGGTGGAVTSALGIGVLVFGILLSVLLIVGMMVSFLFVTQSIVIEGTPPIRAIQRSRQLVWFSFWRVVGIVVLLYVLVQVVTLVPSAVLGGVVGLVFNDPIKDFAMRQSLSMLIGYVAQILVLPLLLTGYTLLYYDQRVRREGYDLELQAQAE